MNRAARHLAVAPSVEDVLRDEIAELAAQIDRRTGAPPGCAASGIYFWHWPGDTTSADTLVALHADAAGFLHELTRKDPL
jgi:hypothetical protein